MALRIVDGRVGDAADAKGEESRLWKLWSDTGEGGDSEREAEAFEREVEGVTALVLIERGMPFETTRDREGVGAVVDVRRGEEGRGGGL